MGTIFVDYPDEGNEMNIELDYPEIWAARQALLSYIGQVTDEEPLAPSINSLIDACFRQFASTETRLDMASTNYSRARALLATATHLLPKEEMDDGFTLIALAQIHATLAIVERDLT